MQTLLGILIVAAVATAGDYLWYAIGVRHTITNGVLHGALLLTVVGGVLGTRAGQVLRGLPIGTLSGIGGALAYYAIIAVLGRRHYGAAIPAAWAVLWLLLATLDGRWLRAPAARPWSEVAVRGGLAALSSGVSFALVLQTLWGRPPSSGRNYMLQFAAWVFAWAPGILILTMERTRRRAPRP
jgi:hypothetical protein